MKENQKKIEEQQKKMVSDQFLLIVYIIKLCLG